MRVHHENVNRTLGRHPGHLAYPINDNLGSLGTRSGRFPLNGNVGNIHQYQANHTSGAGKHETAVLRHANRVQTMANARDPVVMNILKRTQGQKPVSPHEQKLLDARLLYNEKRLAQLDAHKHPSDVSYELLEKPNGDSRVEELINGKPVAYHETEMNFGRR